MLKGYEATCKPMKRLEYIILIVYVSVVVGIYLLGRLFLEMYIINEASPAKWIIGALVLPIAIYTGIKFTQSDEHKWYTYILKTIFCFFAIAMTAYFTFMKADMLISAAVKPPSVQLLKVHSVKKVFRRKLGFDHTNVTLTLNGKEITFKASRTDFFLLQHKKIIMGNVGQSFCGNYYITNLDLPSAERWRARWAYLKDWASRSWYFPAFIVLGVLAMFIKEKFWPVQPGTKPKTIPFFKLLLIIMAVVFAIGLLSLLGIYIYIKLAM
jgi:hypothetical protein